MESPEKTYLDETSLSPAEREAREHCGRAYDQLEKARSWLIEHLPSIGIHVEARWQRLVNESDDPGRMEFHTKIFRDTKNFDVYSALLDEEKHPLCSHIETLYNVAINPLRCLATNSYDNPFIAMQANEPAKVSEFLATAERYLTDQPSATLHALGANPRRAVIDASLGVLRKFKQELAEGPPEGTPSQVSRKIESAGRALDKALAAMEKVAAEPEKHAVHAGADMRRTSASDRPR